MEPTAIWASKLIVFDNEISLTQNVILSHGRDALQAVIRRIDALHGLVQQYPNIINYYPDPDIALIASDICFQQGVASTVLFNDAERAASESAYLFRLRTERVDYVRRLCDGRALQILPDRKMRNSLIHIDEHLAKALQKPNTGWFIDTAIGWRDQLVAERPGTEIAFCRTYISSEDSILHLGNQISLAKLRDESAFVLAAVFGQAVS